VANVLIVEDQADLRDVWAEELSLLGNQIQGAVDGEMGWELIRQHPFDLVLLDIGLPKLSGMEVLRNIRLQNPALPVVVITAVTDPSTIRAARSAGATDILFKPVTLNNLARLIAHLTTPTA